MQKSIMFCHLESTYCIPCTTLFLQITRTEVLYWKVDEPKNFSADRFPVFKHTGGSGGRNDMFYGLPALEYPGLLKVYVYDMHLHKGISL